MRKIRRDLNLAQAVSHTGSWRLDVNKNELSWSEETRRIFGIKKKAPLTYEIFLSLVHPLDRSYLDRKWKAALRGEPYDIDHRILVNDKVKWVRERAKLEFNKKGKLLGGFGTVQDITELKDAQEEVEKLSRFPGENPSPILRVTDDYRILYANKAAGPLNSQVNTLNALNNTIGDIALTNNGDLDAVSVVNNGGDIHLTVNSDLTVGNIQAPGQAVNLTANTGSILDDASEINEITASTVNLTALNNIGATGNGDIDIDSGDINATAGGNIYIESLGPTTFNTISGNGINLLSAGTTFLNSITGSGAVVIRTTAGDLWFTGTVTSTTSGAEITSDNGSIFAVGAGPHLITNANTFLDAPNGTITAIGNHLNLNLSSGFLVLNIGSAVGGVSGRLDGTVPSLSSILLLPSSFPSPLYPPGLVYFNGIIVWPSVSSFLNSQANNTLLGRYTIPVNFQAFLINTADTRLTLFYQPPTPMDMAAFDAAMGIGEGAYEFMGDSLNLVGHEGLLPVFEDIKKKSKK